MATGDGTPRVYTISTETAGAAVDPKLHDEIVDGGPWTPTFVGIWDNAPADSLEVLFDAALPGAEITALDAIVNAHDGVANGDDDYIILDILSGAQKPAHAEGRVFYDGDEHALAVYNDEVDVTHQLGQEGFIRIYNNSGATILNGRPVYVSGVEGTEFRPTIALARADTKATSEVIGFSTHDIENNTFGYVTAWGLVNDLDTSSFTPGDVVYLDHLTAGALRVTPPPAGNFEVLLGYIVRSDVTAGRILAIVNPDLGQPAGDAERLTINAQKGSAGTINPGQAVYIVGYDTGADVIEVDLAEADIGGQMPAIGLARDTIDQTTTGAVIISGNLINQNTASYTVGDELYVDVTAGALTNVKPTGAAVLVQKIGVVSRSHVSQGVITVFGAGRVNDLPNLAQDNVWVGDGTGVPLATSRSGIDDTAIHDNVAGEINAIADKASPVGADILIIEDSAAGFAKKKVSITNLPGGSDADAIHDNVAGEINAIASKGTPDIPDLFLIEDSGASFAKKKIGCGAFVSSPTSSVFGNIPTWADADGFQLDGTGLARSGIDDTAIHDNVAGEINAIAAETAPEDVDVLLIEDSSATFAKKKLALGDLPSGSAAKGRTWTFSTTITDADPGNGFMRLNNATQASATQAFIDNLAFSGVNLSSVLLALRAGDRIYFQESATPSRYHLYRVTDRPVDGTGYVKLPIASVSGGSALRNNKKVTAVIFRNDRRFLGYDAIVDAAGNGDYTSIVSAFNAGHARVAVLGGTYTPTANIVIPDGGCLVGFGDVEIDFAGGAFNVQSTGPQRSTNTGTVSVTEGSATVTGSGTNWQTQGITTGDWFWLDGYRWYEIASVASDTSLTLVETFEGRTQSGTDYAAIGANRNVLLQNVSVLNSTQGVAVDFQYHINARILDVEVRGNLGNGDGVRAGTGQLHLERVKVTGALEFGVLSNLLRGCHWQDVYVTNDHSLVTPGAFQMSFNRHCTFRGLVASGCGSMFTGTPTLTNSHLEISGYELDDATPSSLRCTDCYVKIKVRSTVAGATDITIHSSSVDSVFDIDNDGGAVTNNGTNCKFGVMQNSGVSTDNAIARFDGTSGMIIQNSAWTIADAGQLLNTDTPSLVTPSIRIQAGSGATDWGTLMTSVGANIYQEQGHLESPSRGFLNTYDGTAGRPDTRIHGSAITWSAEYDNGSQAGPSHTVDWNNGQKQKITLTGNITTLTLTAPTAGTFYGVGVGNFLLKIIQGGAGSFDITWPASVRWPGGTAPTLTAAAGSEDIVTFYFDGTNYYGVGSLDFQ